MSIRKRCISVLLVVAACCSTAFASPTDIVLPGSSLETDLLRVQSEYSSILVPLTDAILSTSSSSLTRRDALVQLGNIFFYGNQTVAVSVNGTLALRFYAKAADLGDPTSQFHLGVAYSYGLWGYPYDEAQAMLYYYFASLGNHMGAIMALGHRHSMGISAPKQCETAVRYYQVAANQAMALREMNTSQPRLYDLSYRRLKTIHETQHKKNLPSDAAIVDYYQFSADKGDAEAIMNLATLYYYGARGLSQDVKKAVELFHKAYELGASGSTYHLGHVYHYGIGVLPDNTTALKYLQEAVKEGHVGAQNELAFLYLHGKGVEKDVKQALILFKSAAKQGNMEAFYNLGVLHMQGLGSSTKEPEYEVAHGYFQVAAHQGHALSSHKLGHMSLHGIGTTRSCKNAVDAFKTVAERGEWDRLLARAFKDYRNQEYEAAWLKYAVMAQQGYEVAQHNAAYLLDYGFLTPLLPLPTATAPLTPLEATNSAIQLYKLAALQGNVDANLKIGDYYYYGKGLFTINYTKALAHYLVASKRSNANAVFNVGYMYQYGIGVQQDFILAKRYLDKAIETNIDAHVPVSIALWILRIHQLGKEWIEWIEEWKGMGRGRSRSTPVVTRTANTVTESVRWTRTRWYQRWIKGWRSDSSSIEWSTMFKSDEIWIVILSMALGLVIYIRTTRQYRLDEEYAEAVRHVQGLGLVREVPIVRE